MTEMTLTTASPLPLAAPAVEYDGPIDERDEAADAPPRAFLTLSLADLRFFALCYLAGLIFFLVMLS